jgi:hypothetical protein
MILKKYFPFLIGILTFFSVDQWSKFNFGNTITAWILYFLILFGVYYFYNQDYKYEFSKYERRDFVLNLYLIWIIICIVRGAFIASNYWEYKMLIEDSMALLLPTLIYPFVLPDTVENVVSFWIKWILPIFIIYAIFLIPGEAYSYYLGPIFLLGLFIPIIPNKWKFIIGFLLCLMLIADFSARSQVIKSGACILLCFLCLYKKYISVKILRSVHAIFFIIPLILLPLGIFGIFDIFNMDSYVGKKYQISVDNANDKSAITDDSRTFIYREVITSALRHNYVIQGRTPARGNDTKAFYRLSNNLQSVHRAFNLKHERYENELVHTNIFTWTGLIGCILYSLLYFIASYRAVYRSENFYIKILGVFVAFRWMYGWVEDFNRFDIMNLSLWMMIAICYSSKFRQMDDDDFKQWIVSIFNYKYI